MSLFELLDQARQRFGTSIIVVTHSKAWSDMADRSLRMEDGQWAKETTAS
jgi:ABC-type lipoprotein export system ATPase subunit